MTDQEGKKIEIPDRVQRAITEVSQTEDGWILFQWMMRQCSFHTSTIVGDPQSHEINIYGTLFNEARRRLYLDLRRFIPHGVRRKIEN